MLKMLKSCVEKVVCKRVRIVKTTVQKLKCAYYEHSGFCVQV